MQITFVEWLYNRELLVVEGQTAVPQRDERVAFGNCVFKVVLVTHCYDAKKHYSVKVELEAIANPL